MRPDIAPGGTFPDDELPDHARVLRRLGELQGDDPMILTLARGHYCPKEHQQHLELAAFYPKVAVGYTQMATISTDTHHASQELRALVIHSIYNGYWFWGRPSIVALKALHEKIARRREPVGAGMEEATR
jgi:hypothetical protein